jgi:hypothetical protein
MDEEDDDNLLHLGDAALDQGMALHSFPRTCHHPHASKSPHAPSLLDEDRPSSCRRLVVTSIVMTSLFLVFVIAAVWPYESQLNSI